ncbi:unnamed protein product [Diatraea saccharalis]|uniref:CFAP61 dimerisation domain-containing protein n=1 Tax=Diatraea saccharalis TaxID=40085 RepID=A0A9N9R2N4_9NEOP|nr:unnamed protein product [Diatraea saccharalis]
MLQWPCRTHVKDKTYIPTWSNKYYDYYYGKRVSPSAGPCTPTVLLHCLLFDRLHNNIQGYVMETFKSGYFKIHLNNNYIVDGITCLSTEKYSLENIQYIFSLPSNVLNNVYLRYTVRFHL